MIRFFTVVMCTLLVGIAGYAQAASIGYVDMRKVLTENKTGQRVKADLEKAVKTRKESLAKEEERLKTLKDAYEKDKLVMSATQRQAKEKELQQKFESYQKAAAQAQRELSQKESDYTEKAIPEIRSIIGEIAKEEKLLLVFEKSQIPALYAADGPDLTEQVLARYNKTQK